MFSIKRLLSTTIFRSAFGSLIAVAVAQVALLLSGVITARALGVSGRGDVATFILVMTILINVGSLGLPSASAYYLASKKLSIRSVVSSLSRLWKAQITLLTALYIGTVWIAFHERPHESLVAALIAAIALPASFGLIMGYSLLQGAERFRALNPVRVVAPSVHTLGLILLYMLLPQVSIVLVSVAFVLSNTAGMLVLICVLRSAMSATEDLNHHQFPAKEYVGLGLRSLAMEASPIEVLRLDQLIVGVLFTVTDLGLYVTALAFTNLPRFIAQSLGLVIFPYVARESSYGRKSDRQLTILLLSIILCGLVAALLILLVGSLLPYLFGKDFEEAVPISRVLIGASFFYGVRRILTDWLKGAGRPSLASYAEVTSWIAIVPLALLLPKWFGVIGVAYATLAAYCVSLVVLVVLAMKPGDIVETEGTVPE